MVCNVYKLLKVISYTRIKCSCSFFCLCTFNTTLIFSRILSTKTLFSCYIILEINLLSLRWSLSAEVLWEVSSRAEEKTEETDRTCRKKVKTSSALPFPYESVVSVTWEGLWGCHQTADYNACLSSWNSPFSLWVHVYGFVDKQSMLLSTHLKGFWPW